MKGIPHCCWSWRVRPARVMWSYEENRAIRPRAMPPSTWSTPRRSRPSQRHEDGVDSGGSGCSRMLFGGCWAAGGDWDGDTASGGVAVVGGDLLRGPGDQCHHLSHRPSPEPWRWHLPIPPPALCQLPQRWRWPRAPDREGWRRAAWRDGREGGDRATAGPPQLWPHLRGKASIHMAQDCAGRRCSCSPGCTSARQVTW